MIWKVVVFVVKLFETKFENVLGLPATVPASQGLEIGVFDSLDRGFPQRTLTVMVHGLNTEIHRRFLNARCKSCNPTPTVQSMPTKDTKLMDRPRNVLVRNWRLVFMALWVLRSGIHRECLYFVSCSLHEPSLDFVSLLFPFSFRDLYKHFKTKSERWSVTRFLLELSICCVCASCIHSHSEILDTMFKLFILLFMYVNSTQVMKGCISLWIQYPTISQICWL